MLLAVLQAADTYQVLHLRQHCVSFMVEHFAQVVKTEGFVELISVQSRPLVIQVLEELARRITPPSSSHAHGLLGNPPE